MAEAGGLFVRIGATLDELDRALDSVAKRFQNLERDIQGVSRKGSMMGNVLSNALSFTIGLAAADALRRGIEMVVRETVDFNSLMEQARIGFTTMLGSAEKAQAFLDEMADFAARTPFEYPDLLISAKRMLAMGFAAQEILPTIKAVGDAAAGLGLGREGINRITLALGQMRAKAKVTGEEMRQLTEAGVPAWEILAEAMGKSTAEVMKLSEKGLIPAGQAIQWLVEGMEKRFPDMMKRMENTWEGVTSTIKDVWRLTLGELTSNLFKSVTQWLTKVRDWSTRFYDTFRKAGMEAALATSIGPEAAAAFSMISSALQGVRNAARAVFGTLVKHWATLRPLILLTVQALLAFHVASWAVGFATRVVETFRVVLAALRGEAVVTSGVLAVVARVVQIYRLQLHLASLAGIAHIGVLQGISVALHSVWMALGPVGVAILALSAILMGGIVLWNKYSASVQQANLQKSLQTISDQSRKATESVKESATALGDQFSSAMGEAGKSVRDNLQSFDEVHQLLDETADAAAGVVPELPDIGGAGLGEGFDLSVEDIAAAFEQAKPTIGGFWEWIKTGVADAWTKVKETVSGAWQGLMERVSSGWEVVVEKWRGVKESLSATWQEIVQTGTTIWTGFSTFYSTLWQTVTGITSAVWTGITTFLSGAWNNIKGLASTVWQNIRDVLLGRIDVRTAISGIWTGITEFLSNTWSLLRGTASSTWQSITQVLRDSWDKMKTNTITTWLALGVDLPAIWEAVRQKAATAWEAIRTAVAERTTAARDTAVSIWNTVTGKLGSVWDSLIKTAQQKWDAIKTLIKNTINGIIDFINQFIRAFNRIEIRVPTVNIPLIGPVGGWTVRVPQIPEIPRLAEGGEVIGPTVALLGEKQRETVLPLSAEDFADVIAQAVYQAVVDGFRLGYPSSGEGSTSKSELVMTIDGVPFARVLLPYFIREGERLGMNLVVRASGV